MSMTSHLGNPNSPLSQFFRANLPNYTGVVRPCNILLAERYSKSQIPQFSKIEYIIIGIALDYRIRYYFANTPVDELIAWHGAHSVSLDGLPYTPFSLDDPGLSFVASRTGKIHLVRESIHGRNVLCGQISNKLLPLVERECNPSKLCQHCFPVESRPNWWSDLIFEFFYKLQADMEAIQPVGQRLTRSQEEIVARYCIVLALFEQLYRAPIAWERSMLFAPEPKRSLAELFGLASAQLISDLCDLSWLFHDQCHDLLSQDAVLNPTFDGSKDVGGADADLIVNHCLIDIKTISKPRLDKKWLYQVIGYSLLDYSSEYDIHSVALYMSRQGILLQWPLVELVAAMAGGAAPDINSLRDEFRKVIGSEDVGLF